MADGQYQNLDFRLSEREHRYGPGVHLLDDPFLLTQVARICSPDCVQPAMNGIIKEIYHALGRDIASAELPRSSKEIPTRMKEYHPEGVYAGQTIDHHTKVHIVELARAGMVPAFELFKMYTSLLGSSAARIDHIFINRTTDTNQHVTGSTIHGSKIGGSIENAYMIVPDPMGATGNSLSHVIQHYKENVKGKPNRWIALNLIITPEYIRKLKKDHPEVVIYALRLDRGFSSKRALKSLPGEYWDEEKGLNDQQYIVPGGGGFGELSNNSFV